MSQWLEFMSPIKPTIETFQQVSLIVKTRDLLPLNDAGDVLSRGFE